MPIKKTNNCYQFGEKGKKYCGKGAKEKALKQGRAIKSTKSKLNLKG